jgi:hypothetical protein
VGRAGRANCLKGGCPPQGRAVVHYKCKQFFGSDVLGYLYYDDIDYQTLFLVSEALIFLCLEGFQPQTKQWTRP